MPIPAPGDVLSVDDLLPFAPDIDQTKAAAMVDDALALAVLAAPCLDNTDLTAGQISALRAVLRGAVLRWNEAGTGALQTQSVDDYSQTVDTRQQRRGMFWPSEIEQLQRICQGEDPGAFAIDTVSTAVVHADICAVNFGAIYCSCGALLSGGWPLYEDLGL